MTRYLSNDLGNVELDQLVNGLVPPATTAARTIRRLETETTIKRGTIMAKSSEDDMLVILGSEAGSGETLTPDCIIAADVIVGTDEDLNVAAYVSGCFNTDKVIVADEYTITAADLDALRVRNIVLRTGINY